MEPFSKVLSRQQRMMEYMAWRIQLAKVFGKTFGYNRAINLTVYCRIEFDVQLEQYQAKQTVAKFTKQAGMPVFAQISLS